MAIGAKIIVALNILKTLKIKADIAASLLSALSIIEFTAELNSFTLSKDRPQVGHIFASSGISLLHPEHFI